MLIDCEKALKTIFSFEDRYCLQKIRWGTYQPFLAKMNSSSSYSPPLTRGRKRAAETEENLRQEGAEVENRKRQRRMPQPKKCRRNQSTNLTDCTGTPTRRKCSIRNSKVVLKPKAKVEYITSNDKQEITVECSTTGFTTFSNRHGCTHCHHLEMTINEKHLRIKELEAEVETCKKKYQDLLFQEFDTEQKLWEIENEDERSGITSDEHLNKDKPIFLAILQGKSVDEIQALVEKGEEWDVPNARGDTVLHVAAKVGSPEIVKHFISFFICFGLDTNARNSCEATPLMEAAKCEKNFLEILNIFMENGVDFSTRDKYGTTQGDSVLYIAIAEGRDYECFEASVKIANFCANWNFPSSKAFIGSTVLHVAAMHGELQIWKCFHKGQDDNEVIITNRLKQTSLMCIAMPTNTDYRWLVEFMLFGKELENINLRDANGFTALHLAVYYRRSLNDIKILLSKGAKWNIKNIRGETIIHTCVKNGDDKILEHFIREGANVNESDFKENMPIMLAVQFGMYQALKCLIQSGAKFDANNLLRHAVAHYKSTEQREPSNLFETLKILLEHGASWDDGIRLQALIHFVGNGNLEGVRYCIKNCTNVNARDSEGKTLLMDAIVGRKLQLKVFELLMEMGADINAVNNEGFNVLHLATSMGKFPLAHKQGRSLKILQKLIDCGATWSNGVVGKKPDQESILHAAVRGERPDVVQYFISKGVDVNAKNARWKTPFFVAATDQMSIHYGKMLRVLVNGGADSSAVDIYGRSAMFALGYESFGLVESKLKLLSAIGCVSTCSEQTAKIVLDHWKEYWGDYKRWDRIKYFKH